MKKKMMLIPLAALMGTVILTGCSGTDKKTTGSTTATVTSTEKVTSYTVTIVKNNGEENEILTVPYKTVFTLPVLTREYYDFAGWYTDEALTEVYIKNSMPNHDLTLYACWELTKYGITYELDGGTLKNKKSTYTIGDEFDLPEPQKTGYVFAGWYADSSLTSAVSGIEKGSSGDKTFYAKWEKDAYTITYEPDGGTLENPVCSYTIEDEVTLPAPVKTGYDFAGWYTNPELTDSLTTIEKGTTGDKTLYAKWTPVTYTITYELDGGTLDNPPVYFTVLKEVTLPEPSKNGYTFLGWYTDPEFTASITKIETGTSENQVLYAKWEKEVYTITYDLDGGTMGDAAASYSVEDEFTLAAPVRDGYEFAGWYTDPEFENSITKIEKGTTGNISLYAAWTPVSYSITYHMNGGYLYNTPETYTILNEITFGTPKRDYYVFKGWYTDENFENAITTIETGTTGNLELYAKWEAEVYTIVYSTDGGILPEDAKTTYTVEDTYALPTPTYANDTFLGWYTTNTYAVEISEIKPGTNGNLYVFAKWEAVAHTVKYELNFAYCHLDGVEGFADKEITRTYYSRKGISELLQPTMDGYFFDGWYKENACTTLVESIPVGEYEDITLYAKWTQWLQNSESEVGGLNIPEIQSRKYSDIVFPSRKDSEDITLTTIGEKLFIGLEGTVTSVTLPSSYTTIGKYAMENCTLLKTITLTKSVTSIGEGAFKGCTGLESIHFDGTVAEWNAITKGTDWDSGTGNFAVYCSDGTVYKISYSLIVGAETLTSPVYYYNNAVDTVLPVPAKNHYTFLGWCTDSGCQTEPFQVLKAGTEGKVTLYPKWEVTQYTITYETDGGILPSDAKTSYTYFDDDYFLPTLSYKEDIFMGWYTDPELTNAITRIAASSTGDITLYAKWEGVKYTITYNLESEYCQDDNGSAISSVTQVKYNSRTGATLMEPSQTGYFFDGWYTDSEFTDKLESIEAGSETDYTLYAKWSQWLQTTGTAVTHIYENVLKSHNCYDVYLPAKDVTGNYTLETISATLFANVADVLNSVTLAGTYTTIGNGAFEGCTNLDTIVLTRCITEIGSDAFKGCTGLNNINYDGTQAEWNAITKGSSWDDNTNTFTIRCSDKKIFKINYVCNGGTADSDFTYTYYYTEDNDVELPILSKDYYTFECWYSDEYFDEDYFIGVTLKKTTKASITLYAKFEPKVFSISYKNSETGDDLPDAFSAPSSYTIEEEVDFSGITVDGYKIYSFCNMTDKSTKITKIEKGTTGNLTIGVKLYASHNVSYNLNNGTYVESETFDEGTLYEFPTPTKNGYAFAGWYTEAGFVNKISNTSGVTTDLTLYADWTENTYKINYNLDYTAGGGDDVTNPNDTEYKVSYGKLQAAYKPGFIFVCWSESSDSPYKEYDYQLPEDASTEINLYPIMVRWAEKTNETITASITNIYMYPVDDITVPSYYIYNDIKIIGDDCFNGDGLSLSLKTITIESGIESIGARAFKNLDKLTTITIPSTVTSIGEEAFAGCSSLKAIYYGGSWAEWQAMTKGSDWNSGTGDYKIYTKEGSETYITGKDGTVWSSVEIYLMTLEGSPVYTGEAVFGSTINLQDLLGDTSILIYKYCVSGAESVQYTDMNYKISREGKIQFIITDMGLVS